MLKVFRHRCAHTIDFCANEIMPRIVRGAKHSSTFVKNPRDFVSISTRLVKLLRDVLSLFSVRNSVTQECEGKLLRSNSTNLYLRWA